MADELVVGGMIDSILKGLLGSLKPDFSKLDKSKLKQGIDLALDSLKPTISGTFDDMLLDAAKSAIGGLIDGLGATTPDGPLVVGAKKRRSKEEVEEEMRKAGLDPTQFAPWIMLIAQFIPLIIDMINWLRSRKS